MMFVQEVQVYNAKKLNKPPEFEYDLTKFLNINHAVGVANATDHVVNSSQSIGLNAMMK